MGMTEILVILVIAMIFLGPEKLPEAAAKISKGIREIRKQSRELQNTIETDTEIGGAIRDLKSALRGDELRRPPVRKVPLANVGEVPAEVPPQIAGEAVAAEAVAAEVVASAPEPAAEPVAAEPAAAAPAEPDENDPLRLIRPAANTAKREHG